MVHASFFTILLMEILLYYERKSTYYSKSFIFPLSYTDLAVTKAGVLIFLFNDLNYNKSNIQINNKFMYFLIYWGLYFMKYIPFLSFLM